MTHEELILKESIKGLQPQKTELDLTPHKIYSNQQLINNLEKEYGS